MAAEPKRAGIVTTDDSVFRGMVGHYSPDVADLALACRSLIFEVFPETVEVVWPHQRTAGYGTGPKKLTEHFCWLAPYSEHVVFGFFYGSELTDPEELLEGTGRLMRHVKVRTAEQLDDPALRRLVETATTHRVPPPKATR